MRLNKGQNNYQDRVLAFAVHRLGHKSGPLPLDFIYKYLDKDINQEDLLKAYGQYLSQRESSKITG